MIPFGILCLLLCLAIVILTVCIHLHIPFPFTKGNGDILPTYSRCHGGSRSTGLGSIAPFSFVAASLTASGG